MRFKKGSKVEVLSTKDSPSGSWRIAKVISGDGHSYLVRYYQFTSDSSVPEERVPRKAIRPCPPAAESMKDWMSGDQIEVFENMSWKPAKVSRVLVGDRYLLELLDSPKVFITQKCFIRTWQSWQNNQWVVVQKDSRTQNVSTKTSLSKGANFNYQWRKSCIQLSKSVKGNHFPVQNDDAFGEFNQDSTRSMRKRKCEPSPTEESSTKCSRKFRVIEKTRSNQQPIIAGHTQEKVGAVSSAKMVLGERLVSLEYSDDESCSSSVGSCSIYSSPYSSPDCHKSSEDFSTPDQAETYGLGIKSTLPIKEDTTEEIHQLELHAFRSVMMALYASGPISWEQESLMTNLRLMLNISNDELLLELRNLMSK